LAEPSIAPEQQRFRLSEAGSAFLAAIAAEWPLIFFVDDVQWADVASMDLLVHVATRSRSNALLIVAACRDGDAAENPPLQFARTELDRRRLLAEVHLEPLAARDAAALATHVLGAEVSVQATYMLHHRSEGNTFFFEELLRALWRKAGSAGMMTSGASTEY
jgi:predicted ATPase